MWLERCQLYNLLQGWIGFNDYNFEIGKKRNNWLCVQVTISLIRWITKEFKFPNIYFHNSDEENENNSEPVIPDAPVQIKSSRKSETACEMIKKIVPKDLSFHIVNGEGAGQKVIQKRVLTQKDCSKFFEYFQMLESFPIWLVSIKIISIAHQLLINCKHYTAIGFSDEVDVTKFTYDCGGSLISQVRNEILMKYLIFNYS